MHSHSRAAVGRDNAVWCCCVQTMAQERAERHGRQDKTHEQHESHPDHVPSVCFRLLHKSVQQVCSWQGGGLPADDTRKPTSYRHLERLGKGAYNTIWRRQRLSDCELTSGTHPIWAPRRFRGTGVRGTPRCLHPKDPLKGHFCPLVLATSRAPPVAVLKGDIAANGRLPA